MSAEGHRLRAFPFVFATAVSAVLILWAPFIGQIRSAIRTAFPGQFVRIVGGTVGVLLAVAIMGALVRIRERRATRYSAIAAAVIAGTWYASALGTGNPEVDAVERFHFVEYGLVTLLFYRAWRPLGDGSVYVLPVLCGFAVGTLEEWFQWFIPVRIGEMRDVFLNGAAIGCGLLFSVGVDPPVASGFGLRRRSATRIGIAISLAGIVFALFLHTVHLGHLVNDDEAGAFLSRYPATDLARLQRDRAVRWTTNPPLVLHRLSREDQYMSEGIWHVQARNKAWDAGNVVVAWHENRILEKFYAPVLDAPSFVSRTGHRWAPGQRVDAAQRLLAAGGPSPGRFVSAAHQYPIYAWSKPVFWTIVSMIALLVSALAIWLDGRAAAKEFDARREEPRAQL